MSLYLDIMKFLRHLAQMSLLSDFLRQLVADLDLQAKFFCSVLQMVMQRNTSFMERSRISWSLYIQCIRT
ncbi:hypothetical protein LINGRAHAP2_LOCUS32637 [Linum grandiflorum]